MVRLVLIETLWNVKENGDWHYITRHHVLIETLWNVKWIYRAVSKTSYQTGINRNIVECKVE